MIIAIDETGDFNPNSELTSFFVAVLIDQSENGLEIKKQQFYSWLESIPKDKINKGEVKGSNLNDYELESFVEKVYNPKPYLSNVAIFFKPKRNPESLIKIYKEIESNRIIEVAQKLKERGQIAMANKYDRMAIWHKNAKRMHYQNFIKLILLRQLITKSFPIAIVSSTLLELLNDDETANLLNIKFKIDQDFIRGDDPKIFWKEFLRNEFITDSMKNPIPVIDKWRENGHPFLKKYKSNIDGNLDFKDVFNNNCDFLESHEHFEIQISDITGIIINRYHNRRKAINAYNKLYEKAQIKNYTEIILNDKFTFGKIENI